MIKMKSRTIKNKRGDIPITILVIGVLAVCGLVIFSFYSSSESVNEDFGTVSVVEKAVKEKEKISLYEGLGFSDEDIERIFNVRSDAIGDYILFEEEGVSVKYYLPG